MVIRNRFGEKLDVLYRIPENADRSPLPVVLFISGFGMDLHEYKNSNDEVSKKLVDKGIATLQFSFAGCGASEGDYRDMTIARQAAQIEDMIAWLSAHADIDAVRIGVHATSFGVPATISAEIPLVRSYCFVGGAYYPGKSLRQVFIEERGAVVVEGEDVRLPRSSGVETVVGKQFFPDIDAFDTLGKTRAFSKPVLIIHGDQDTKVSVADVKSVYSQLASGDKQLKIFPGGDHPIVDVPRPIREEFLDTVVSWFQKTLH